MTLKIRSRSSMMIFHIVTHTNHISVLKGIDGYRKYVRIISMISTYKGKTFIDVILTTLEIIIDYILIYRFRIVDNAKKQCWHVFFPNRFDWRHWPDFLTGPLVPSYRSDERVWYVADLIFYFILSKTFHWMKLFTYFFFCGLYLIS